MFKFAGVVMLLCVALACAEPRVQQRRGLAAGNSGLVSAKHPYLFLSVPHGRSGGALVQGFEVIDADDDDESADDDNDNDDNDNDDEPANDDDDDDQEQLAPKFMQMRQRNTPVYSIAAADNDDDDDDDDIENDDQEIENDGEDSEEHVNISAQHQQMMTSNKRPNNLQMILKNAKPTQMMVPREHAGAIMVPDGIIEIEGQSVVDEKTGKTALLVPRAALDAIPDGSVVALMERSVDEMPEERANRVIVRRRRKGSRRNVRRRGVNKRRRVSNNNTRRVVNNNRRVVNNRRRGVNRRQNVRVVRPGNTNNRRRGVKRTSRPVRIQG